MVVFYCVSFQLETNKDRQSKDASNSITPPTTNPALATTTAGAQALTATLQPPPSLDLTAMLAHRPSSKVLLGLACVLGACVTSGLSGVYFEMLVKTSQQRSVVVRNIQLGEERNEIVDDHCV